MVPSPQGPRYSVLRLLCPVGAWPTDRFWKRGVPISGDQPVPRWGHRNAAGFFVEAGYGSEGWVTDMLDRSGRRRVDGLVADGRGVDLGEGGVSPDADGPLVDFGAVFDKVRGQG